jgi:hypothetical protein
VKCAARQKIAALVLMVVLAAGCFDLTKPDNRRLDSLGFLSACNSDNR